MKKRPLQERFCEKVDTTQTELSWDGTCCHVWRGHILPNGYGQISQNCKAAYAHRVAWELAKGAIVDGSFVLHRCDNRQCVNVNHLFLGTFDDNMADMVAKRRQAHGVRNGHAKLTEDDVLAIRASGELQETLAARYGVTRSNISMVRSKGSWQEIG